MPIINALDLYNTILHHMHSVSHYKLDEEISMSNHHISQKKSYHSHSLVESILFTNQLPAVT